MWLARGMKNLTLPPSELVLGLRKALEYYDFNQIMLCKYNVPSLKGKKQKKSTYNRYSNCNNFLLKIHICGIYATTKRLTPSPIQSLTQMIIMLKLFS